MNKLFYFGLFLILFVFIFSLKSFKKRLLGFTNYNLAEPGIYPSSVDLPILSEVYPYSGSKTVSDDSYPDIWWHYPVLKTGSYKQITNNLRYYRNPDEGTCMPASMCGALYHDKFLKSNYIEPLPPLNPDCGTRVGYFDTNINLLPYRTNVPNILY